MSDKYANRAISVYIKIHQAAHKLNLFNGTYFNKSEQNTLLITWRNWTVGPTFSVYNGVTFRCYTLAQWFGYLRI